MKLNGISKDNPEAKIFVYTNGTIPPKEEQLESFQGKNVNLQLLIMENYLKILIKW